MHQFDHNTYLLPHHDYYFNELGYGLLVAYACCVHMLIQMVCRNKYVHGQYLIWEP